MNTATYGCDTHLHFYDRRFGTTDANPFHDRSPADYRPVQRRLGLGRLIVVQPSMHGTDNRPTVNAIAAFGDNARGVAVVHPDTQEHELHRLHRRGIRGVRLYLRNPRDAAPLTLDTLPALARLAQLMGWHLQLNLPAELLVPLSPVLRGLAPQLVFDHVGKIPQPGGVRSPEFALVRDLLTEGRAWVKISGAYLTSQTGAPTFDDVGETVRALAEAAPERVLWGSNWPHPTVFPAPDDRSFLDLMPKWLSGEAAVRRMLVDNPATLYGFSQANASAGRLVGDPSANLQDGEGRG